MERCCPGGRYSGRSCAVALISSETKSFWSPYNTRFFSYDR